MSTPKNPDFSQDLTLVPKPYEELNYTQRMYIDWKAVNGLVLVTPDDAEDYPNMTMRKMPLTELASLCGIKPISFKDAKAAVPNFWDLVAERRKVLNGQSRLAAVHETWYLKARKGDWQHLNAWLLNFDPNYKEPRTKHEIEPGNALLDALNIARSRRQVIEGEVVNGPSTDTGS